MPADQRPSSGVDVQALFDRVMKQKPSDRLRLAAMLLDTDPSKAEMALSIAKSACGSIELPLILKRLGATEAPEAKKGGPRG